MANRSDHSDGESGNERAHPRRGHSSTPPRLGTGGLFSAAPAIRRPVLNVIAPPQLDAPKAESGGTASVDARVTQFQAKARGRTARRGTPARNHLSHASIPQEEALAMAHA